MRLILMTDRCQNTRWITDGFVWGPVQTRRLCTSTWLWACTYNVTGPRFKGKSSCLTWTKSACSLNAQASTKSPEKVQCSLASEIADIKRVFSGVLSPGKLCLRTCCAWETLNITAVSISSCLIVFESSCSSFPCCLTKWLRLNLILFVLSPY